MAEAWMGVDLGTSGVRAVVVAADGTVLGEGEATLESKRQGTRHEQDPNQWWAATCDAVRQATMGVRRSVVRAVAVCATSGTMCLVDETGEPVTPGVMYDDWRASAEARDIEHSGVLDRFSYRIQPGWALAKLLWFRNRGELNDRVSLSHQSDFVTRRLVSEEVASDSSHALKSGYDPEAGEWPEELFDELELPRRLFPRVVPPGTILGEISQAAADASGLEAGTAVVAGMTDGCAGQLAAGAVAVGSVNAVLGTTLVLKGVTEQRFADPTGVVYSHRSPDGHWLPGGASSVGAGVLDELFGESVIDDLIARSAIHRPAPSVSYPLVGRGERFPFLVPDAERFFLGEPRDEAERCAAVVQGVAYVERLAIDHLGVRGARLDGDYSSTGGGTRSPDWCQIRADILGRPLRVPFRSGSAFGMALLASASDRGITLAEAAAGMVQIEVEYHPAPDAESTYRPNYELLLGALFDRGWIDSDLVDHATERRWAA